METPLIYERNSGNWIENHANMHQDSNNLRSCFPYLIIRQEPSRARNFGFANLSDRRMMYALYLYLETRHWLFS
jgi:hypothetical protein